MDDHRLLAGRPIGHGFDEIARTCSRPRHRRSRTAGFIGEGWRCDG
jgi:hypothetical protein